MKSRYVIGLGVLIAANAVFAQVPQVINYQGRVTVCGTNFDGTGQFQFALVNGTGSATYWSNGVSTVSIPVSKGFYSVLLGDTGMSPIPYMVFANSDVRLRIWFNSGSGLQQLSPDQRIGAVGYAMSAAGLHASTNGAKWDVAIGAGAGPAATGFTFTDGLVFSKNGQQCAAIATPPDDAPFLYSPSLVADDVYSHSLDVRDSNWETVFYVDSLGQLDAYGRIFARSDIYAQSDINTGRDIWANRDIKCAGTKYFVQPHPTDPTKEITYICLEGPEAGTYARGSAELVNGQAEITLPDHFGMVTCTNGLTVQLTPRGAWLQLYATAVGVNGITVQETEGRSGKFDYLVQGVRLGYENTPVIRDRQK